MEIPNESDFQKNILDLIYNSPDSQAMLREIAEKCGNILRVDSCVIIAGVGSLETTQLGFWHQNQVQFTLTESFLSHPEINTVLATEQPCALSNDLAEILSVTTLLGARTQFQGSVNGFMILGKINQSWTIDDSNQLLIMSKYVSIGSALALGSSSRLSQSQPENRSVININRGNSISEIPIMRRLYNVTRDYREQQIYLLEQERQLNEKKNDIIAAISDKARNPLATMKLAIDTLSNRERKLPPQSQETYWNILRQEWNKLNELINSIVTLKKLQSKEITYQPQLINLNAIIKKLESALRKQWNYEQRKALSLNIDFSESPSHIYTDLQHLENLLQELLTNAIHFSEAEQTIFVKLSQMNIDRNKAVCISITNTGLGISATEKESIYEPFYRSKGAIEKGIPGVGVGLAVVKELVEFLGGKIEMTSNPINNSNYYMTCFTIIIPLKLDHHISAS
ncbi:sensor histidine kinase KdpD [Chroococcus sp. FPU101]|uniref:sensor histidine kinase n=1 Tax=Chroococcus sp. FPU101 TaxID=1974212 RepID=UPI001A8CBAC6|nr:HAMP domain-containing sensor histidine kinase [Chroococcus sp. FPU101]GFE71073.1 histidine kinase [Chroococcus sp. FPU101]